MSKLTRFEQLECWQQARLLVNMIYRINGPLDDDYDAKRQARRASISVMNNIAEGFARFSRKEKVRFFDFAQSSAGEVKSMLYLFEDLEYLDKESANAIREQTDYVIKLIVALIRYIRTQQKS